MESAYHLNKTKFNFTEDMRTKSCAMRVMVGLICVNLEGLGAIVQLWIARIPLCDVRSVGPVFNVCWKKKIMLLIICSTLHSLALAQFLCRTYKSKVIAHCRPPQQSTHTHINITYVASGSTGLGGNKCVKTVGAPHLHPVLLLPIVSIIAPAIPTQGCDNVTCTYSFLLRHSCAFSPLVGGNHSILFYSILYHSIFSHTPSHLYSI